MMMDITQLRSMQQAADLLNLDRNYLSYYVKKDRFARPYIVAGVKHYLEADILAWKPSGKTYDQKTKKA